MRTAWKQVARRFILQELINHPLPWKAEWDWTCEVVAADGQTVAKCASSEEAEAVIKLANKIQREIVEGEVWVGKHLKDLEN